MIVIIIAMALMALYPIIGGVIMLSIWLTVRQFERGKEMKNYKNYEKQCIGCSDIASLILRGINTDGELELKSLKFGSDGVYWAYVVDADTEIPEHYTQVAEFKYWMQVYDDMARTATFRTKGNETIKVYRAGMYGCIIQRAKEQNETV